MAVEESSPTNTALSPGKLFLGRYRIEKPIGVGGMTTIYLAWDQKFETYVAIKTLSDASADSLARFTREARCIAKVKSKHVVKIYDFGDAGGRPYIAMECLRGQDLRRLLRKEGPLDIWRAVDINIAAGRGLAACHFQHQLIHRDIKPANVFLHCEDDRDDVVKLLDFGISTYPFAAEITGFGRVAGTLNYMSPEQAKGHGVVEAQSDQYSLAVVLYECLTKRLPYDGSTDNEFVRHLIAGEITRPRVHRPEIPQTLEDAILRALSLDPDDRFPNIQEFGLNLLPFASEVGKAVFHKRLTGPPAPISEHHHTLTQPSVSVDADTKHERDIRTVDNRAVKTVVGPAGSQSSTGAATAPDQPGFAPDDTEPAATPAAGKMPPPASATAISSTTAVLPKKARWARRSILLVGLGALALACGLMVAKARRTTPATTLPETLTPTASAGAPNRTEAVPPATPERPTGTSESVPPPGAAAPPAPPADFTAEPLDEAVESAPAKRRRRSDPRVERTNKGGPILR